MNTVLRDSLTWLGAYRTGRPRWSVVLLLLAACSPTGPVLISPEEVLGDWAFRSNETEWCKEWGPRVQLQLNSAALTIGGRINVRGSWEVAGLPKTYAPSEGGFSGLVDGSTGEFELLLWRHGNETGQLTGTMNRSRSTPGRLSWGFCPSKVGERTTAL